MFVTPQRPILTRVLLVAVAALASVGTVASASADSPELRPGFAARPVISGLDQPIGLRFAPDGRLFVIEKGGIISSFDGIDDDTPTVVTDLRAQVYNVADRGLLGLAIDPRFDRNRFIYVFYTRDATIGGTAPLWGTAEDLEDPCRATDCPVSSRISRLRITPAGTARPERPLVSGWCQQSFSHSAGSLEFGADGQLYASGGDGAGYTTADWGQLGGPVLNPCDDPPFGIGQALRSPTAEGGALRAQDLLTRADPVGLAGTVIRIDPRTGLGSRGNPLAGDSDPNARRIVGYGLRNPFRLVIRPGTNELWIGDVGWRSSEEINRMAGRRLNNFGWPCYEGPEQQSAYAQLDLCKRLYATGGARMPYFSYSQASALSERDPCDGRGGSIASLTFYDGHRFPRRMRGSLFFADYMRGCIWEMRDRRGRPQPDLVRGFAQGVGHPADLEVGPDGNLYYADVASGAIIQIAHPGT